MSGDLQAKRKSKNRSKKKSQLQELAKGEHFEESLLGFGADSEDTPPPPASSSGKNKNARLSKRREKKDYSYSETDDSLDNSDNLDDDGNQNRHGSKVGILTKFLFFSLLIGFVAVAGLSVGVDDYRSLVSADTIKLWGSECMLPDFQGLQSHFNLDSVSKTYQSLKESTELFLIRPVRERVEAGVQFLRNVIDGEKQTEEEVHVNDDSEDYTPELNEWIRSYEPTKENIEIKETKQQQQQQQQQPEVRPQQQPEHRAPVVQEHKVQTEVPQQQKAEEPKLPQSKSSNEPHLEEAAQQQQQQQQQQQPRTESLQQQQNQPKQDPTLPAQPISSEPKIESSMSPSEQGPAHHERTEVVEPPVVKVTAYTLGEQ